MLKRQDIKEILIVLLLAAIAVGISEGAKYYFYEHIQHDNNTVENIREDKTVSNSFCMVTLNKDLQPVLRCKWDTPESLKVLYGYSPTRRA